MRSSQLLTLLLALSACQHAAASSAKETAAAAPEVPSPGTGTLGPEDVFEVKVFQEPDLSGIFRLAEDGTVDFPLCGRVHLEGQTSTGASELLTRCLANGYLRNPQVSVFLKEYNFKQVFVFGEVQKPGNFQYRRGMNIVQAITLAGGFAQRAARNSISVTRLVGGTEKSFKVGVEDIGLGRADNFSLEPGDIIFVPQTLL